MRYLGGLASAIVMSLSPVAIQAATLTSDYLVTSSASERANRDVALSLFSGTKEAPNYWLTEDVRGIFYFEDPGRMTVLPGNTWEITGRVIADDSAALGEVSGFDLRFSYNDVLDFTPVFKSEGGSVEHGNESYINMTGGVLTGFGALAGLDMTVSRMPAEGPYATQIGGGLLPQLGANNHNENFGLANWFFVDELTSNTCGICIGNEAIANLMGGDLNGDLTPIPLPGAGLLLLGGLAGFAAMRRRA